MSVAPLCLLLSALATAGPPGGRPIAEGTLVTRGPDGAPLDTVAYALTRSSDGAVWVDAGPPHGTTVRLPASAIEALHSTLELRFPTEPPVEKATVALDRQSVRVGLSQSFSLPAVAAALALLLPLLVLAVAYGRSRRQASLLGALASHHVAGREAERLSLSREIHDGPVQALHVVSHALSSLDQADGGDVRAQVRATAEELRRIAAGLRPPALDRFGLVPALDDLADHLEAAPPHPRVRFERPPAAVSWDALAPETALALYRVAQEACQNAVAHGGAHALRISVLQDSPHLTLRVQDDGRGFDADSLDLPALVRGGHFGLAGMHERVRTVGGRLSVSSLPGRTLVEAQVPL